MGGGASLESAHPTDLDYSVLKSSGVDFAVAYKAIENRLKKGKSANVGDVSIPFLAIRQLSKNLRNQDSLERTRRKVLKSRSLPNNLKLRTTQVDYDVDSLHDENLLANDELDPTDLAIVYDPELEMPIEPTKAKTKKPALFLHVADSFSVDPESNTLIEDSKVADEQQNSKRLSPSANARISPSGAFHVGKIKVLETGIMNTSQTFSFRESEFFSASQAKFRISEALPPALGGKRDFVEIATLGTGASGVVSEAIHIPSLTIVALKMLPIYNQEKRQHVSRELTILCKNLADMHLISDTLENEKNSEHNENPNRCQNILSLYNAFIDPKSGLINLVIEYMDGGSLEDLVCQGGCVDEQVLADVARQSLNGLMFLHKNKSVHRDIKPANILCSSSGVIKIADFGISKVLDQTTGFANSFVGTVCYMSP
jgi:hypothetical protein